MSLRVLGLFIGLVFSSSIWAYTCYFTLAKDSCWLKYDVTVNVLDARTSKNLLTITVPAGKSWERQTFSCEAGQKLLYKAQFSPNFWEADKGKVFMAKNYWSLPDAMKSSGTAWTVNVCFTNDFSNVPAPPDSTGRCACDFSSIPAVPPQ